MQIYTLFFFKSFFSVYVFFKKQKSALHCKNFHCDIFARNCNFTPTFLHLYLPLRKCFKICLILGYIFFLSTDLWKGQQIPDHTYIIFFSQKIQYTAQLMSPAGSDFFSSLLLV